MEITPSELIVLLGYKEAEIYKLRQRVLELEAALSQQVSGTNGTVKQEEMTAEVT